MDIEEIWVYEDRIHLALEMDVCCNLVNTAKKLQIPYISENSSNIWEHV